MHTDDRIIEYRHDSYINLDKHNRLREMRFRRREGERGVVPYKKYLLSNTYKIILCGYFVVAKPAHETSPRLLTDILTCSPFFFLLTTDATSTIQKRIRHSVR